jgi:hypothetical protein
MAMSKGMGGAGCGVATSPGNCGSGVDGGILAFLGEKLLQVFDLKAVNHVHGGDPAPAGNGEAEVDVGKVFRDMVGLYG